MTRINPKILRQAIEETKEERVRASMSCRTKEEAEAVKLTHAEIISAQYEEIITADEAKIRETF
jgi:hypothetical protein